jgi:hypothetical protein
LGIPTSLGVYLVTGNFYVSIISLFLKYTLSEGWISPAIAMIQQVIDVKVKGVGMFLTLIF